MGFSALTFIKEKHRNSLGSRIARISQRGWLFLKFDSTENELHPNFHLFSTGLRQIQSVFLSKIKWSPKKKVFTEIRSVFFVNWHPLLQLISRSLGGLFSFGGVISRFRTKINLKTAKNMPICILFRPMGGLLMDCTWRHRAASQTAGRQNR